MALPRFLEENEKLASPEEARAFLDALLAGDLQTFREIATRNPKILQWQHPSYPTILHRAADCSTVPLVEYLLSLGYDVNARDTVHNMDYTPLWYASKRMSRIDREAMVRFLIERGANVKAGEGMHCTPLHHAASQESP